MEPTTTARPRWRRVHDVGLAIVILVVGGLWGARFERAWHASGRRAHFYQNYFEPAVMLACGHGFVRAEPQTQVPGLHEFLTTGRDDFSCSWIPPDVHVVRENLPVQAWYHFMVTVGFVWRLTGVSWSGLNPLFGLLFGLVLAVAYGLFRLALGPGLALIGTFFLATSPGHLVNLPPLRDYAKAPFALAALLFCGWLVTGPFSRRRVLTLSTLSGLVVGVGYGFRTDLLAAMPPLLLTPLLFLPGGLLRNLGTKALAALLCLAGFALAAWPALSYRLEEGSCQGHVVLLGLTTRFDAPLGIEPASYDWGAHNADMFIYSAVGSHAVRGTDRPGPGYCTPEYDRDTDDYLETIARLFPADLAVRALGSIVGVSDFAFDKRRPPIPEYDGALYRARRTLVTPLHGKGPLLVALASLLLVVANLRAGLWALFVLGYFGAYPMLQFEGRHHFHLEWIGWLALLLLCAAIGRGLRWAFRRFLRRPSVPAASSPSPLPSRRACLGRVCLWLALVGLGFATLFGLRHYQRRRVPRLLRQLTTATSVRLALVPSSGEDKLLLPGGLRPLDQRGPHWADYLRLQVRSEACQAVTARYDPATPSLDFSRTFRWPDQRGEITLLLPVFSRFVGFEIDGDVSCVSAAYRAADLTRIPLWLFAVVPSDPAELRAYQTLRTWDHWTAWGG